MPEGPESEEALLKLRIQLEALGEMHRVIQAQLQLQQGAGAALSAEPQAGLRPFPDGLPPATAAAVMGELVQREYEETQELILKQANISSDRLQRMMSAKRMSNMDLGIGGGVQTAPGVVPNPSSLKRISSINRRSYIGGGGGGSKADLSGHLEELQQSEAQRALIYRTSYAGQTATAAAAGVAEPSGAAASGPMPAAPPEMRRVGSAGGGLGAPGAGAAGTSLYAHAHAAGLPDLPEERSLPSRAPLTVETIEEAEERLERGSGVPENASGSGGQGR